MPRNGSGTASIVNTFSPSTTIKSSEVNANFADIASMLTGSIAADGQTTVTGAIKGFAGTASAPGYGFAADPNTGVYRIGEDQLGFATGGTLRVTIDASGNVTCAGNATVSGNLTVSGTFVPPATFIDGITALTAPDVADEAMVYDASAGANRKITLDNLLKVINTLTEDTSPDETADFLLSYDTSATTVKKVKPQNLQAQAIGRVTALSIGNNATTPTTKLDIAADDAILVDSSGIGYRTGAISLTLDAGTTGANGLDTGSLANSTWYYIWLISNGTATASLLSTSATAPTMPSGYTYKLRIGTQRTGGSATFLRLDAIGSWTWYRVVASSTTSNLPILISGTSGSTTVPTWTSVAWANFAPPTAKVLRVAARNDSANRTMAAPSNAYGSQNSQTNPPPLLVGSTNSVSQADFVLESSNIFYASASGADGILMAVAWRDAVAAT